MKKALIGLCNNVYHNKNKIKLWAESFSKYCDGDIILLAANVNEEDIKTCEELSLKYEIITVDNVGQINHKRLFHISEFLRKDESVDLILVTDVFDVMFQNNPFSKWDLNNYDVFVSGEGVEVCQEPWNFDNIQKIFPHEITNCLNQEIICSGIIGGKKESLIILYDKMYQLCEIGQNDHNIKDQAALIVMVANNQIEKLKIFNLDDGWAMHCAVAGPTQFFESWGFKNNLKYGIPKLDFDVVKTNNGQVFDMVHQFNRIPDWHNIFNKKYNI